MLHGNKGSKIEERRGFQKAKEMSFSEKDMTFSRTNLDECVAWGPVSYSFHVSASLTFLQSKELGFENVQLN